MRLNGLQNKVRPRMWLLLVLLGLALLWGVAFVDRLYNDRYQEVQRTEVLLQAATLRAQLEGNINSNVQSVLGLVSVVSADPAMDQAQFARYAAQIFRGKNQLRNLGAAPDMVIRLVYPLAGNENAVGLDLAGNDAQREAALRAASTGAIVVAGPVDLAQGGQGFIGRFPVFTGPEQRFWGLVSAVIDLQRFYAESGLVQLPITVALRGQDSTGAAGAVFYGDEQVFKQAPVLLNINLPSGSWQLGAAPLGGWRASAPNQSWLRAAMLLVTALILGPMIGFMHLQRKRMAEQHRLQGLFEHSPLGLAFCDARSGTILSCNPALRQLSGGAKEGRDIRTLFETNLKDNQVWQQLFQGETHLLDMTARLSAAATVLTVNVYAVRVDQLQGRPYLWVMLDDISERDRAMQAQLDTARQLQMVVDSTGIGFWDWHIASGDIQVNDRWLAVHGLSADHNVIQLSQWLVNMHDMDRAQLTNYVQSASIKSAPFSAELRIKHGENGWLWVHVSGRVVQWNQDQPERMVGTVLDNTERKQAGFKILESQQQLQNFFSMSPVFMTISNLAGKFEVVNAHFMRKLGYKLKDLLHMHLLDLVHPDDMESTRAEMHRLREGIESVEFTNRVRTAAGRYLTLVWNTRGDSLRQKFYSTAIDMSETLNYQHKLARQQDMLTAMSRQGRIGAWEYDANTGEITWTAMTKEIHGLQHDFEPTKENIAKFYQVDDTEEIISDCIRNGLKFGKSWNIELFILTEDGQKRWVASTGQAQMKNGRCERLYGSFQDIDRRKRIEDELRSAKEQAENAAKVKGEFLAMMSHEIRTPLNGVMGMLNLLDRTPLDSNQQHQLHVARRSAVTLLSTINDILDFSKVDAGKLVLASRSFDIHELFEDVVEVMSLAAHEKNLYLVLDQHALPAVSVKTDPDRLRQILINLVSNAIKFTETGEVCVAVQLERPNQLLNVSVRDTGIGMPAERLKDLFLPFSQLDSSSTRRFEGTGLGLVITRKLCEMMGGDINVVSAPGKGSTFSCQIRLDAIVAQDRGPLARLAGQTAVVAIGNQSAALALVALLDAMGAQTYHTEQLGAVEALVRAHAPELLFVDLALLLNNPDWRLTAQGASAARRILVHGQHVHPDHADLRRWGLTDQVAAPVTRSRLLSFLQGDMPSQAEVAQIVQASARVMLVEDNHINREVATMMLADCGCEVISAENGAVALEALRLRSDIALVFMDCLMPTMDGFEATRRIRKGAAGEHSRELTVIALTANAMRGDRERCLAAGMNDFLSKPLDPNELAAVVERWLPVASSQSPLPPVDASATQANDKPPVWDRAFALRSVRQRRDRLDWLIETFIEQHQNLQATLETQRREKNYKQLDHMLHTLKGSAGQLGGKQVYAAAIRVEASVKRGDPEDLRKQLSLLFTEVDNFMAALQSHLASVDR